jgi:hypothetical protein
LSDVRSWSSSQVSGPVGRRSTFFHVYECDIAPTVEVLHVAAGDVEAGALIDFSRALVEVRNIEDHTSARKPFMSEFPAETNEGEAEAPTAT